MMGEEQRITGGVSQTSHIMAQWWGLSYIHMDRAVRVSLQSSVAKRVPTKRVKIRKTVERADTRACAVGDRQASSSRQRGQIGRASCRERAEISGVHGGVHTKRTRVDGRYARV